MNLEITRFVFILVSGYELFVCYILTELQNNIR